MIKQQLVSWYNFDTGETDYFEGMPDDLRPYVSDYPAARNMFDLLVEMGNTQVEAFLRVAIPPSKDGE